MRRLVASKGSNEECLSWTSRDIKRDIYCTLYTVFKYLSKNSHSMIDEKYMRMIPYGILQSIDWEIFNILLKIVSRIESADEKLISENYIISSNSLNKSFYFMSS